MTKNLRSRILCVAAIAPLAVGLAACGHGSESETAPSQSTTKVTVTQTPATSTSSAEATSSATADGVQGQPDIHYTINSQPAPGAFVTHKCKVTDKEIEFKAEDKTGNGESIKVDLDLNPDKLDEIEIIHQGQEYETNEAQEAAAEVKHSGHSYTVKTQVANKADTQSQPLDVEISFSCGAH